MKAKQKRPELLIRLAPPACRGRKLPSAKVQRSDASIGRDIGYSRLRMSAVMTAQDDASGKGIVRVAPIPPLSFNFECYNGPSPLTSGRSERTDIPNNL